MDTRSTLAERLAGWGATLEVELLQYEGDGNRRAAVLRLPWRDAPPAVPCRRHDFAGGTWRVELDLRPEPADPDGGVRATLSAALLAGEARNVSLGARLSFARWSDRHYVFLPAAAYAGNRFRSVPSHRQSHLPDPGPDMPVTIANVMRLETGPGRSRIQALTSDLSTPGAGLRFDDGRPGLLLLCGQGTRLGNSGVTIEESGDRLAAELRLTAPGVREEVRYNGRPSTDRGADFALGDPVALEFTLHAFPAPDVDALFARFFDLRNLFRGAAARRHEIPFSSAWAIQERKYNAENWVEEHGYYSVGMRESPPQDWQTGWVGGLNTVYALLAEGSPETRRRAQRTFDFVFSGQLASGFLAGCAYRGQWQNNAGGWVFLRCSADALYFLAKEFLLLRRLEPGFVLPARWADATRRLADAFAATWRRYGQFGHYVRAGTGEMILAGTCAAGIAPAGLALCAGLFDAPAYLDLARAAAARYGERHVAHGIANGGPGDILQAVDSESAFGLLESYVTLFEATGERRWLDLAVATARQCATWCTSYDFGFPPASTFGKLGMLTTGTVWANVQNKHAAPGICTLSGCSLLKLFRATGDRRWFELLAEIAHAMPQYMSREDRPIRDRRPGQRWPILGPGWINERVNLSDWEVRGEPDQEIGVGEIFGGSTWSEAAQMLSIAELPGLYVQPDTRLLVALDHVDAELLDAGAGGALLRVTNPTKFPASVKVLCERSADCARPLGPTPLVGAPRIEVPAGATAAARVAPRPA